MAIERLKLISETSEGNFKRSKPVSEISEGNFKRLKPISEASEGNFKRLKLVSEVSEGYFKCLCPFPRPRKALQRFICHPPSKINRHASPDCERTAGLRQPFATRFKIESRIVRIGYIFRPDCKGSKSFGS